MGSKKRKNKSKKHSSSEGMDALLSMRDKLPKGNESNAIDIKQPPVKSNTVDNKQPKKMKQQTFKPSTPPKEKNTQADNRSNQGKMKYPHDKNDEQKNRRRPFNDNRVIRDYNNRYPLPKDVNFCLDYNEDAVSNASLVLHRYVPWSTSEWKIEKNKVWQEIEQKANDIIQQSNQAVHFLKRQERLLKSLKSTVGENQVTEIKAKAMSKLSIGFGNSTPLETGLTLHRLHGLPCIPGTSIKGICRSWKMDDMMDALQLPVLNANQYEKIKNKDKKQTPYDILEKTLLDDSFLHGNKLDEVNAKFWEKIRKSVDESLLPKPVHLSTIRDEAQLFSRIFGNQDAEGEICFFDVFPTVESIKKNKKLFSCDIINVHFQQYYDNKTPPADYLSPVPNYFLTVSSGTMFRLILLKRKHTGNIPDNALLNTATEWLTNALEENGLGSKTAVGYGEMRVC
jgi:CRISPR-associated protein Cmr6